MTTLSRRRWSAAGCPCSSAALAVRAGLDYTEVADILTDPARTGLTVLLRAIDMRRPHAAAILLRADPDMPSETIERWMAAFEALDPDQAREVLRPRQLDPEYRAAIVELHQGIGRRGQGHEGRCQHRPGAWTDR